MVRPIFVERYLYVGFRQLTLVWELKLHIPDIQSTLNPLVLVVGVYAQYLAGSFVKAFRMVQVLRPEQHTELVSLYHIGGVGEKKVGVGLQMNQATIGQKMAIAFHEVGGGKALACIFI